ncbi:hypothetical protein SAMD00019534_106480 [Acytostelium subglobosum LB1]|uniref:hypothetical protein n=1 Tax=Acytostelium subglobosum LB1 TaxID=1410327 RepID=UPI000644C594|nr:hypothetical protein SAMD00019534_106480 [Acytostelium subglobosum LB1]GAM27472.1 hypothetical protein SAMD00019534_106480 [Acytostelium subglobosum LB1]|eukprot:XP_012749537.1 hypothetical protein SAMD00019534_106480 [Acytostelium subglobosum LB1]
MNEDERNKNRMSNKVVNYVGFIDAPLNAKDLYPYNSKVGGSPVWMAQPPAKYSHIKCTECSGDMAFLMQLYAPLDHLPQFERSYYLFVCHKCNATRQGWKLIKSMERPRQGYNEYEEEEEEYDEDEEEEEEVQEKVVQNDTKNENGDDDDDWGVEDGDDWGLSGKTDNNNNNNNIDELLMKRDKMLKEEQAKKKEQKNNKQSTSTSSTSTTNTSSTETSPLEGFVTPSDPSNQYKECYVTIEEEVIKQQKMHGGGKGGKHGYVDDHSEMEEWSGESYEYVKDRAFSKFIKRINHYPEQVIRYGFGGEPLCMSQAGNQMFDVKTAYACKRCGKNKVFEFQVVSTIITQISHNKDVSSLDFSNLFALTCPNHCYDVGSDVHNDVIYVEELLLVEKSI